VKPINRKPDIENLYKALRGEQPDRPVLFELFLNDPLYRRLAGDTRAWRSPLERLQTVVEACRAGGYDYASSNACDMHFPTKKRQSKATVSLNDGFVITDEAGYEAYPWPDPDSFDYSRLQDIRLPDGMKLMVMGPCGVMENAIALMGYENMCYMQYENPNLLKTVIDQVGARLVRYYANALTFDSVGLICGNDDWGFNTQTFFSPAAMREYFLPWHQKIVAAAHAAGRPAVLHSCGNLSHVIDDVIDMGYDAKHSYEDNILPVEQAYDQWHGRIAIFGGIDVDFMVRSEPDAITRRCRAMLERSCQGGGGYALGTGNSVPEYLTDEKYFAMTRAALEETL
jgi:uroporphyrinogen decarboxylase